MISIWWRDGASFIKIEPLLPTAHVQKDPIFEKNGKGRTDIVFMTSFYCLKACKEGGLKFSFDTNEE